MSGDLAHANCADVRSFITYYFITRFATRKLISCTSCLMHFRSSLFQNRAVNQLEARGCDRMKRVFHRLFMCKNDPHAGKDAVHTQAPAVSTVETALSLTA